MYSEISQFEPLFPAETGELEKLAYDLVESSARLEGRLSPATLSGLAGLLRIVNSYYSNLIEGHNTHPIDIQRAMQREYSADDERRDLQIESRIHIEVQQKIVRRLAAEPETNIAAPEFLLWIHQEFYRQMPERLSWAEGPEGGKVRVEAGRLRAVQVAVGRHLPPVVESLSRFLERFGQAYDPAAPKMRRPLRPLIALAAAHHRLMWIHPFLDGNGRVARLFTDAYFYRLGFAGYGLWNVSRGLARQKEYKRFLAAADEHRDHDFDGRGNLSNRTLTEFCRFFLETCLDQSEFMNSMLALGDFLRRLESYVERRDAGLVVNEKGERYPPLPPRTAVILKEAASKGELTRGEIYRLVEMSERTGRKVIKNLLNEGLLVADSDWHKSTLRLGFPAMFAAQIFPGLFPADLCG